MKRDTIINVQRSCEEPVIQGDTKKTGTFEMRSGSHVQLAALRNRDLELQTTSQFSNHGSVEGSTACFRHKNVLVLMGFQKFPFFCVILYLSDFNKTLIFSTHFRKTTKCKIS